MNVIDAIKSGRPYRRKAWFTGTMDSWRPAMCLRSNWNTAYTETVADLTADDWEIMEPTATVTRSQIVKICHEIYNERTLGFAGMGFGDELAQRLGLK